MAHTPKSRKSRKLTAAKARQIFRLYHLKGYSQRRIAVMFDVSRSCVFGVTHEETWKEATEELAIAYGAEGTIRCYDPKHKDGGCHR